MNYTFAELLEQLPNCDNFPMKGTLPDGLYYPEESPEGFIAPNLTISEEATDPENCQVIIISAPGAVGKSTLASAMSAQKNALMWDLASAREVAAGSLNGLLYETFEDDYMNEFIEYISEGMQFLIIDALDEGRIKVNENAFRRLLEDISERAKDSKGTCFVLLGRTRISEESWLVLDEKGVSVSLLAIEPFDRNQANEYINNRFESETPSETFNECRDLIFERLAFSVSGDLSGDAHREFLHYPPVLDVVARLLEGESNLFRLVNRLRNENADANQNTRGSIALLQDVIEHILLREKDEKVVPAVKTRLEDIARQMGWSDWNGLYTVEEQSHRLLGSVLNVPVTTSPPGMPGRLHSLYEDAIATSISEHPFLQGVDRFANLVFKSYLYSQALRGSLVKKCSD